MEYFRSDSWCDLVQMFKPDPIDRRWNRRRAAAAVAMVAPLVIPWFRRHLVSKPSYSMAVFAHPATPLPEDVRVTVEGMCRDAPAFDLPMGSKGHRQLSMLCPHCVESRGIQVTFTATERTFFLHHGSHRFVLRGNHANLPFNTTGRRRRNLAVSIGNFRHPDLLDVRVNGRFVYPV